MNDWEKIGRLSRAEHKKMQDGKLRDFIAHQIYAFSPYYRALFDKHKINPDRIRTVEDLRYIPFTSKNDFISTAEAPRSSKDFILQPNEEIGRAHV
jgi:phenylacetate-CoA ligase